MLLDLVQLNLELHHLTFENNNDKHHYTRSVGKPNLFAAVLQIPHKRFLDTVELGKLHVDSLARPLEVLRALGEVLATLNSSGCHSKCALEAKRSADISAKETSAHLELFVNTLQTIN